MGTALQKEPVVKQKGLWATTMNILMLGCTDMALSYRGKGTFGLTKLGNNPAEACVTVNSE